MKRYLSLLVLSLVAFTGVTAQQTSVAGFYPLANSGRVIYNFNQGWRFLLGDAPGAEAVAFDDSHWEVYARRIPPDWNPPRPPVVVTTRG